ncbi:MAG: hypothetical protein DRQ47_01550, partial [Gammaproteobacteria bacterium]
MRRILLILLLMLVAWKLFGKDSPVILGEGVKVATVPIQKNIDNASSYHFKGYQITPLASFKLKAKILAKEEYFWGREADLSPVDLALGWQNMSDESVLDKIEISQSGRWYYWSVASFPIPRRSIETQSANMHMVPATEQIEGRIDLVREGQIVEISGKLIRVDADDGWIWKSSLSREDT